MATVHVYGIKACDTMKKTFSWLEANGCAFTFYDYKKTPLDAATLDQWCESVDWQILLNTKGTTWRKLSDADRSGVDEDKAKRLMLAHNSLVKRPVVAVGKQLLVGFAPEQFAKVLVGKVRE